MATIFEQTFSTPVAAPSSPDSSSSLFLPPSPDPAAFASSRFNVYTGDAEGEHARISFAKGTTTLAFRFRGGIVVSVDSRSTQGPYIGA